MRSLPVSSLPSPEVGWHLLCQPHPQPWLVFLLGCSLCGCLITLSPVWSWGPRCLPEISCFSGNAEGRGDPLEPGPRPDLSLGS